MEKEQMLKEIRTLLAMNEPEGEVAEFLIQLGCSEDEAKKYIEESKKDFSIDKDLERLRKMGAQPEAQEEEKELTEQEKRVRFVKTELGDLQKIVRNISTDITESPNKKPQKPQKKKN